MVKNTSAVLAGSIGTEWLKTHVRAGEKDAGSMRDNLAECLRHRPGWTIDLLEMNG